MHHIALLVALIVSAVAALAFAVAVVVLSRKLLGEQRRCVKKALDSWIGSYQRVVNAKQELKDKLSADLRTEQARTQQAENRARLATEQGKDDNDAS